MQSHSTSPSLLEALRGGADERSWARFVREYDALLLSFAKRLGLGDADACDVTQETLAAVFAAFQAMPEPFDRTQGRFRSWLRGIARHKVIDALRAGARHAHFELTPQAADPSGPGASAANAEGPDAVDQAFERDWRLHQLAQALEIVARESDPAVYQAFFLTFIEKQDPAAVARLLGVSRNAVYVSKCKTLKRVREAIARIEREDA